MSNQSPSNLTPFQQRALTRIQTMETETKKVLYERMRDVCREEMRGTLAQLLTESSPSTQLVALNQQSQEQQAAFQALLMDIATKLDQQPGGLKPGAVAQEAARAVQGVLSEAEDRRQIAAQNLLTNLRESQQSLQRVGWKMIAGTVLAAVLVVTILLGLLWLAGKTPTVITETQRQDEKLLGERLTEAKTILSQTEERIVQRKAELLQLEEQKARVDTNLQRMAETQQQQAKTLAELTEQMTKLQQLQEQFRFKLIAGQDGVFVEVAPNTMPFVQGKQTLIRVNP